MTTTLTIEDLQAQVPAAFATGPAKTVSKRYSFIPTIDVVTELVKRGWFPVRAKQSKRIADRQHATHIITFQRPSDESTNVGDVIPEINVINNHSASKMFRLIAGLFRKVCSNGLMIATGFGESEIVKVHKDGASIDFDQAFGDAVNKLVEIDDSIQRWKAIEMSTEDQLDFARQAILLREFGNAYNAGLFRPQSFLKRRRKDDQLNDLWTVFNVVQENIIMGGVKGITRPTKPITQVAEVQRINQGLWQLAETYGKLHGCN